MELNDSLIRDKIYLSMWVSSLIVIIATSDQHLGYKNSDKIAFNLFLDYLQDADNVTHFVLLGDVVDMWRRDASGVFLENRDNNIFYRH